MWRYYACNDCECQGRVPPGTQALCWYCHSPHVRPSIQIVTGATWHPPEQPQRVW